LNKDKGKFYSVVNMIRT